MLDRGVQHDVQVLDNLTDRLIAPAIRAGQLRGSGRGCRLWCHLPLEDGESALAMLFTFDPTPETPA